MKPAPARPLATSLLAAALLVGTAGCGGGKKGPAAFTPPPVPVEVAEVTKGGVRETVKALGTVEAAESVKIAAEIDARVVQLPFREGALVQKGQVLAVFDDSERAAEVTRAEALRDQASQSFKRFSELARQRIASTADRDNSEATLKVAEADVNLARARLAKSRVAAPFTGVLGRRLVSPGAYLRAGESIVELARIDEVKLTFSVSERNLPAMKRGATVTVTTVSTPGKTFTGTISVVEPSLDAATRTARIVALVPNADGELQPGMSAEVTATLGERKDALTVPDEAVFAEGDRSYVFAVKDDGTVTRRAVKLGAREPGSVEVVEGLTAGEKVVRAGHQKLYEGAKVSVAGGAPKG